MATSNRETVKSKVEQVASVLRALYDEMDKLNRKSAVMPVSEMALAQVNKTIVAVKEALSSGGFKDSFVDDLTTFVSAGDEIEVRDVVLVLGQLRAGVRRFVEAHEEMWATYSPLHHKI